MKELTGRRVDLSSCLGRALPHFVWAGKQAGEGVDDLVLLAVGHSGGILLKAQRSSELQPRSEVSMTAKTKLVTLRSASDRRVSKSQADNLKPAPPA